MAKNLQARLPPSDSVSVFDINREAMQRLAGEMKASQAGGASVELASSAADASSKAVRSLFFLLAYHLSASLSFPTYNDDYCSIYDLSCSQRLAGLSRDYHIYKANPLKSSKKHNLLLRTAMPLETDPLTRNLVAGRYHHRAP